MHNIEFIYGYLGGLLIGLSALTLFIFNGKITGISGITFRMFFDNDDKIWRFVFLLGLMIGAIVAAAISGPLVETAVLDLKRAMLMALSGLLVGSGTYLANGCTSGHGVCGIGRLSTRSLIATAAFMGFGIMTATLVYWTGQLYASS